MADGRSNGAIAVHLHVSRRTVESHIGAILDKLVPCSGDLDRRVTAVLVHLAHRPHDRALASTDTGPDALRLSV